MSLVRCQRRGFNGHKAHTDPAVFFREVEHIMEGNHPNLAPVADRVQRLLDLARGSEAVPFDDFGVASFMGGSNGLSPNDIEGEDEILVATLAACGRLVWSEDDWAWMLPS